ncbi:metal-dependent hydrolase [Leeuwenhoekiella sp. NPDC079379]|uniref:metal-dependent hydrolase n=1 Tax=Leeuwenhoekiella sp. NPDC079379 TaxID=3364122 RepID=UPI0037CAC397
MKITYYGQNCFGFETEKATLLTDPFITGNDLAKDKIDIKNLNPDFIFLTHAHQDHTLDAEAIAKQSGATIVSNYEIANHYAAKDLETHPMNHGGSWEFSFGKVKYVNAIHTSSFPDGSYGGQPGGFVFSIDGKTIYMAGDTALTMDMKLIPLEFDLDVAILPIGDNFTMGIGDAVRASDFIECNNIIGCHYDTFGFIEIDHDGAKKAFSSVEKKLTLLEIGESIEL